MATLGNIFNEKGSILNKITLVINHEKINLYALEIEIMDQSSVKPHIKCH